MTSGKTARPDIDTIQMGFSYRGPRSNRRFQTVQKTPTIRASSEFIRHSPSARKDGILVREAAVTIGATMR